LYSDDHHYKSLVDVIQNKEDIVIATKGSKSRKVSGGNWVITDSKSIIIVEGHNPDFDNINGMNSHCYKITGVLSTIVFVHEYCKYFLVKKHADSRKKVKDFTLSEHLNIRANKILFTSISAQLAINIKDTTFAIIYQPYLLFE